MSSPDEPHTRMYSHVNGTHSELHDRFAVSELCKGWAVYRDASEWMNFRSMFADDAYVWTTRESSGAFIMHRECGTLVELNSPANSAVGKMKATITQRFGPAGAEYDVDCDCRFFFFCEKMGESWRIKYAKLIYEKDKVVPVCGVVPSFDRSELEGLPEGYRYLGAAQRRLGYEIDRGWWR